MLVTNTISGKSPGGDSDLQSYAQIDPQAIEIYREIYLQIASRVQNLMSMEAAYNYEKLYKIGCDHPRLSHRIDLMVSYELRLCGYSKDDQINILLYGPYIQSQMLYHHLSESGARHYVCQRLAIAPTPPAPLELDQAQPTPTTAA